ncbi:uncharacterized protein LOC127876613 [Dreissena polymorpha]|uniref:EF-hand domain-containing protein n=1 Tax=Dreissena polymorpha TaxID=45954 RepID=A0A9D4H9Q7_DREPO|nr:uncharacterized protein LOC127876613 [Dreissena polymorpha]KAH3830175.1 hypothetical protein DPMN_103414 [Dreissena polymorpha]
MGSPMPGTSRGPASVLKELFEELADENGRITSAKLRSHVVSLGLEFTDEEIREMLEIADTSGKGAIDYKGFVELVRENADHLTALESSGIDLKREITMLLKELTVVKKQTEINNQNDTMVSAQKKNDDRLRTQPNYTSNGEKDADVVTGSAVKEQCIVEPSEPGENKNKETTDNYSGNEDQTLRKKQILQKTNIKHLVNNENST